MDAEELQEAIGSLRIKAMDLAVEARFLFRAITKLQAHAAAMPAVARLVGAAALNADNATDELGVAGDALFAAQHEILGEQQPAAPEGGRR